MAAVTGDASITRIHPSHDPSAPEPARPIDDRNDDLFNYDADIDGAPAQNQNASAAARNVSATNNSAGLGIDEEIKIRKPRKKAAKLDEDRLLSEKGIPKLRRISKDRLKFRGKGHEFSDVSKLLTTYQLWLDDLFPKAKFGDGLALIEKLGHKKRLQVMRKEWIDEEKNKPAQSYEDLVADDDEAQARINGDEFAPPEDPEHEELYAAPTPQAQPEQPSGEPDEDELDALLAEDAVQNLNPAQEPQQRRIASAVDDFADEEEAMADMW